MKIQLNDGRQRTLQPSQVVPCRVCRSDGFTHIDIGNGEQSAIKLTIDDTQRLVYVRSSLIDDEQLAAVLFDPPVLTEWNITGT